MGISFNLRRRFYLKPEIKAEPLFRFIHFRWLWFFVEVYWGDKV